MYVLDKKDIFTWAQLDPFVRKDLFEIIVAELI